MQQSKWESKVNETWKGTTFIPSWEQKEGWFELIAELLFQFQELAGSRFEQTELKVSLQTKNATGGQQTYFIASVVLPNDTLLAQGLFFTKAGSGGDCIIEQVWLTTYEEHGEEWFQLQKQKEVPMRCP